MKICISLLLLSFLLVAQVVGSELIINGDFEQPLSTGWGQIIYGSNGMIDRATDYDSDEDYEAYVYKGSETGFVQLLQVIGIPTTNLNFSIDAKLYAYANSTAWAGAAVLISYSDQNNVLLGQTYICARTTHCPWTENSTTHIIDASDSEWHYYGFNIDEELTRFAGVNPSDVAKIQISLYCKTSHC